MRQIFASLVVTDSVFSSRYEPKSPYRRSRLALPPIRLRSQGMTYPRRSVRQTTGQLKGRACGTAPHSTSSRFHGEYGHRYWILLNYGAGRGFKGCRRGPHILHRMSHNSVTNPRPSWPKIDSSRTRHEPTVHAGTCENQNFLRHERRKILSKERKNS